MQPVCSSADKAQMAKHNTTKPIEQTADNQPNNNIKKGEQMVQYNTFISTVRQLLQARRSFGLLIML